MPTALLKTCDTPPHHICVPKLLKDAENDIS
jgi:hypothetical protein